MRIGLDCDGVLADFHAGWIAQYNEWFNARLELEQESWSNFVEETHFSTEADFWAWVDRVPDFWVNMPTIGGAMGGVLELQKAGHELLVVTHRHEKASLQTKAWFEKHWPLNDERQLRLPTIHHTKRKASVDCQLYVDDGPKPIASLMAEGRKVIKFSYPYNKGTNATCAVHNWAQLTEMVEEMAQAIR